MDGKYRIEAHLSSGGMGDVYVAEHAYTRRRVALKVIRPKDDGAEARFLREAEAVCAVDHPSVVEMLDAGRARDGTWYAVFELLDGDDLETLLDGGVPPAALVRIAVSLLEALAATHAAGYVHRDVKPANVFVGWDAAGAERVKLLDFGIAERMGPEGAPALGQRVGTLDYMSPEQARGDDVDGRTDVWSVGALLFRGLTGLGPLDTRRPREALTRLLEEGRPTVRRVRPDLPADLVDIVDRALERRREDRWAGAADMAQALLLLDPEPLLDLESPRAPRRERTFRPERDICAISTVDLLRAS